MDKNSYEYSWEIKMDQKIVEKMGKRYNKKNIPRYDRPNFVK